MTRSPAELAEAWRDALVAGDPDAFGALFAEGARFVDVEHRSDDLATVRPVIGRAAIEAMCRRWLDETPEFEYRIEAVLADATSAAVRWRYRVGSLELDGASWLECEAGAIVEARVWFDSLALFRGLGRV